MKQARGFAENTQVRTNSPGPPTVREAVFDDYSQIESLLSRYALEAKSYEAWQELWNANPVYQGRKSDWPIGWVLETEDRKLVGYLGNIPLWYEFGGQRLIVAVTYGWVVEMPYRTYSLLLLDRYFSQGNIDLFLSTTVNAQASDAFTSFNSPRVPVGAWDRSLFWIGDYRGLTRSWAAMKALSLGAPFICLLSVTAWLKDRRTRGAIQAIHDRQDLQWCSGFDERFDRFWETVSRKQAQVLLSVRTREVLQWHFGSALRENRAWLLTHSKKSTLVAYAIFLRQDNPRYGLKRLRLVDFQTLNGNTEQLRTFIARALRRCREHEIHMLEYVGPSADVAQNLELLAPRIRVLPCWSYYYKAQSLILGQKLTDPKVWRPSLFDGDSSL